jgi:hypothetical protein
VVTTENGDKIHYAYTSSGKAQSRMGDFNPVSEAFLGFPDRVT